MNIALDDSTVKALEHRAQEMGIEVEPMTNELLKTVIADEAVALQEFEDFMRPRIESARRGEFVDQSVEEIFDEVLQEDE
jgi:hypothetical protein